MYEPGSEPYGPLYLEAHPGEDVETAVDIHGASCRYLFSFDLSPVAHWYGSWVDVFGPTWSCPPLTLFNFLFHSSWAMGAMSMSGWSVGIIHRRSFDHVTYVYYVHHA